MRYAVLSLAVSFLTTIVLIRSYVGSNFSWILEIRSYYLISFFSIVFFIYLVLLLAIDFNDRLSELIHVLSTVLYIPIFIVSYAMSYRNIDLCHSDIECVYFSIVTFTTLGYGDILPNEDSARILAASEAFLGFLFVPVLVAQFLSVVKDFKG